MTPGNRSTAKIVGFLLLGLAFSAIIGGVTFIMRGLVGQGVAITLLGIFGIYWAYRFMRLGRERSSNEPDEPLL